MNTISSARWEVVRQASQAKFRQLYLLEPMLLRVAAGRKKVWFENGDSVEVASGQLAFFREGQLLTIENALDASGPYRAEVVTFAPEIMRAFRLKHATGSQGAHTCLRSEDEGLLRAFYAIRDTLEQTDLPREIVAHRLEELLLWAKLAGFDLGSETPAGLPGRVRTLLAADVQRKWRAAEVATHLGVSEPTLRRRLAEHETSFQTILTDVRLSQALALLQTTSRAVTQIAFDVGYDSPSRFSQNFRARFDLPPSKIRGNAQ